MNTAFSSDHFGIRFDYGKRNSAFLDSFFDGFNQPQNDEFQNRYLINDFALSSAKETLWALKSRKRNWDFCDSEAPQVASIAFADELLDQFYAASRDSGLWIDPHFSSSEIGVVTLEWWFDERKLTVYADQQETLYIKVWGADIDNEMEDGVVSEQNRLCLWQWLTS